MKESTKDAQGIALFVDLENLVGSAYGAGLPVDLSLVINKLKEYGPIRYRRGYGDLRKVMDSLNRMSDLDEMRRRLQKNLLEIVDIPYVSQFKNAADMQLIVDALSLAFQNEGISHYAILASDRDYVPLFGKLREIGKSVIAIGVDESVTHPMIREASDSVLFYNLMFATESGSSVLQKSGNEIEDEGVRILKREYMELLQRALRTLEEKGKPLYGTAVYQQMRALRSDFQTERIGCPGFKEFARLAKIEGNTTVHFPDGPGDLLFEFTHPVMNISNAAPVVQSNVKPADQSKNDEMLARKLRKKIEEDILRIPLPDHNQRRMILEALSETYAELILKGPFYLSDLTDLANMKLLRMGVTQASVFKTGLSLYFSRCFSCRATDIKTDPEIVGKAVPEEFWEDKMLINILTVALKSVPDSTARSLSMTLFGKEPTEEQIERCQNYLEEVLE